MGTGSSPGPLGTSTSFTLLGVDVLASLTLLSVQPRHASKESKVEELELEFTLHRRVKATKPVLSSLMTITH